MRVFLKVKIKSLAAEAKIIRREEKNFEKRILIRTTTDQLTGKPHEKWKVVKNHPIRADLRSHRLELRWEQRHSLLAYAFMRGKPYKVFDTHTARLKGNVDVPVVQWDKVKDMAQRFGADVKNFGAWVKGEFPVAKAA